MEYNRYKKEEDSVESEEQEDPIDNIEDDISDDDNIETEGEEPMEKHQELLRDLTNFSPFLKKKFNEWLGVTWNERTQKYEKNSQIKPIMNIQCADWLISFLSTYTRKNNIITNITQDDYKAMMYEFIDTLWFNLGTRMSEFGIRKYGDIQRIATEVQHATELVLMGAGDGKYNQLLRDTHKESAHYQPQEQKQQGSWWGRLFGGA